MLKQVRKAQVRRCVSRRGAKIAHEHDARLYADVILQFITPPHFCRSRHARRRQLADGAGSAVKSPPKICRFKRHDDARN